MTELLIILGVVVLSISLRTTQIWIFRKAGAAGFLAATFLTGYFSTGKIWIGIALAFLWLLFPWIELLTRTRKLRLPVKRKLNREAPPGAQRFPELGNMTSEIEEQGFEYVSDTGWQWEETHQFFRFFYHAGKRIQAAICFTEQSHYSWACVSLTTRLNDGRVLRSTNIPFSNPMKTAPGVLIRRDSGASSFEDMMIGHEMWLEALAYTKEEIAEQKPDDVFSQVEEESGDQISHNVESGIIALCEKAETWRYSWRGLCYLYFQVLKDFLRWC